MAAACVGCSVGWGVAARTACGASVAPASVEAAVSAAAVSVAATSVAAAWVAAACLASAVDCPVASAAWVGSGVEATGVSVAAGCSVASGASVGAGAGAGASSPPQATSTTATNVTAPRTMPRMATIVPDSVGSCEGRGKGAARAAASVKARIVAQWGRCAGDGWF